MRRFEIFLDKTALGLVTKCIGKQSALAMASLYYELLMTATVNYGEKISLKSVSTGRSYARRNLPV